MKWYLIDLIYPHSEQKIIFACFIILHLKDKSFFINYQNF